MNPEASDFEPDEPDEDGWTAADWAQDQADRDNQADREEAA